MSVITSLIIIGIIAILTFLVNILIVYLTIKMKSYSRDSIYLIGLAIVDTFPFIIILIIATIYIVTNESPHKINSFTQVLGFIDMAGPSLSSQLAASLALHRLLLIYQKDIRRIYTIIPYISSVIIIILLTLTAVNKEFMLGSSGLTTQPSPRTSVLSAITFYYLFIHTFLCNLTILVSYALVLKYASNIQRVFKLSNEDDNLSSIVLQKSHFKKINLRGWLFICLSGFILLPGILLFLIGGLISNNDSIDKLTRINMNAAESYIIVIGGLINSLLVLFFHPGINNELKKLSTCF